jgi:HAE1 family hydrophobic/amphiphilic exporter-1
MSQAIANAIRTATIGEIDANVAKFSTGQQRIPIRVRLDDFARADLSRIGALPINTIDNKTTPLASVASLTMEAGPSQILRYDRERRVSVQADLNGSTLGEAMAVVERLPVMQHLPSGVHEAKAGESEELNTLVINMVIAMGAGILMIYFVMVLLFGSFFKPVTILVALPLTMLGAFAALKIVALPITLPVFIGLLMLMGLAAKNSILLVEFAIEAERAGKDRREAMLDACRERARPIVMTTLAMSAGMLPTALAIGEGAAFRQPMAVAVIGGLFSSTVLSLILVPVVYELIDRFEAWLTPKLRRLVMSGDVGLQTATADVS